MRNVENGNKKFTYQAVTFHFPNVSFRSHYLEKTLLIVLTIAIAALLND